MRRKFLCLILTVLAVLAVQMPASAGMFRIAGKPASYSGFIFQELAFSTEGGDHYDVEGGLNQALMRLFLEGDVRLSGELSFYASGMLTFDWIYELKRGKTSWNEKRFDQSRDTLFIEREWWQILREAHLTWTPGDFTFRIGKQVVSWGEMFVWPVNDFIMPTESIHNLQTFELELLFAPIPLFNARYDVDVDAGPFRAVGAQFVFNPNPDFVPSVTNIFGNDRAGVWAVDVVTDEILGFPTRIGRLDYDIEDPGSFDPDFFEYGLRLNAFTQSSIISIMAFYGRNNLASNVDTGFTADSFTVEDTDGNAIINFAGMGFYPIEKFVGAAWSFETPFGSSLLGGVHPIISAEFSYRFDEVFWLMNFETGDMFRVKTDQLLAGLQMDWKVKTPWHRAYFGLLAEARFSHYMDRDAVRQNEFLKKQYWVDWFFAVNTTVKRWNLQPGFIVVLLEDADLITINPYMNWIPSTSWKFSLAFFHYAGSDIGRFGSQNKDNITLRATRQF